jgi:hypothetical protein
MGLWGLLDKASRQIVAGMKNMSGTRAGAKVRALKVRNQTRGCGGEKEILGKEEEERRQGCGLAFSR